MEINIARYSGVIQRTEQSAFTVHFDPRGLREIIARQWPDLKLPARLAIIPFEDYAIISADCAGQVMTPHRDAVTITIPKAPPPIAERRQSRLGKWAERAILWAIALLAALGLVDTLTRLAGIFGHAHWLTP